MESDVRHRSGRVDAGKPPGLNGDTALPGLTRRATYRGQSCGGKITKHHACFQPLRWRAVSVNPRLVTESPAMAGSHT